jgi:hypothetical protein
MKKFCLKFTKRNDWKILSSCQFYSVRLIADNKEDLIIKLSNPYWAISQGLEDFIGMNYFLLEDGE